MKKPSIALTDLSPEARERVEKQLGLSVPKQRKPRERKAMTIDQVRSKAIEVLAVVSDLPQSERTRVLRHALKVNDV